LLRGKSFTHVFDNFAKDVKTVETVAGKAKAEWKVKNYAYVSSAGMYESKVAQPMVEIMQTKTTGQVCSTVGLFWLYIRSLLTLETTGQREVEMYLEAQGLPWTAFRPQYIYGPKTNKRDYLDWFFHRITRDRVCPLPGDGKQKASVSHVEDVAAMMTAVVGKEDVARGQVFNCGTETCVTYADICKLVGKTVGKEAKIMGYNPKDFELPKGAFPFRNTAFYVSPAKARNVLGWRSTRTLEGDMDWYYESYKAAGQLKKEIDFSADDMILAPVRR
jgi:nucleoside-diphosphate-sugar epimerase